MKIKIIVLTILLLPSIVLAFDQSDYVGYWSFSDEWMGDMGAALEVKNDGFKYWFYSDVKSEDSPQYPITGKTEVVNGVLNLITDQPVYAKKWYLVKYEGTVFGIFPLDNLAVIHIRGEKASTRMMALVSKTERPKTWPIMNAVIPQVDNEEFLSKQKE